MADLLVTGGLLFTVPLTLLGIGVLLAGFQGLLKVRSDGTRAPFWRRALFHMGLFSFVLGIFSQGVGLYQAMTVIEIAGAISPALLAGGLKVSLIPALYGLIIFLVSMVLRFALDMLSGRTVTS